MQKNDEYSKLKKFYDSEYYGKNPEIKSLPWHYKVVARRLGDLRGKRVLDVACGTGDWLAYLETLGAEVHGIDISERAIDVCKERFKTGEFRIGPAEELPFDDNRFDLITCLGSLEHFVDPETALKQMCRVSHEGAKFLLLVPNAGFLSRRLGLYAGTQQTRIREVVRSLSGWQELFQTAHLQVIARWRDLHVITINWIASRGWLHAPLRAAQALVLPLWPMSWQYQVHHLCVRK